MSRILIVDDHAVTRSGYRQFLHDEQFVTGIGEAGSGVEALASLRVEKWDLLMLDIQMPDCRGLDILRIIRADHPELAVLIVSGLPEEQYAREAMRAGANGYLSKGSSLVDLMRAIRVVLSKRRYISESLADLLAAGLGKDPDKPLHSCLSPRELQIFCCLATGRGVTKISLELGLSTKTVSTYRSRILEKMTFRTNANMTTYAIRNGLIG